MRVRAGILVTGTEVLTGIIKDKNGPWLSERFRENGFEVARITIVGDRPSDLLEALEEMRNAGIALVATSGGLGPTADDLTAEVVGRFQGREMVLDEALEERIAEILRPLAHRWPNLDLDAVRAANRKQAVVPAGSTILDPVGTAPGLVVTPSQGEGPTVLVLPGPPRELIPMWEASLSTQPMIELLAKTPKLERRILRLFGMPESERAGTHREIEQEGLDLSRLEITTCLRRGEIEIATTWEAGDGSIYDAFEEQIIKRHGAIMFARNGETIDELVAGLLKGRTVAVAESCTGGLFAARICDQPGASDYFLGGSVAYSNSVKIQQLNVTAELIESHGAVSNQVAAAMAEAARERFGADFGVGITGVAGPDGGTEDKPVGLVWFAVASNAGCDVRSVQIPGGRADVRERSTTIAMHLLHRALRPS